MTTLVRTLATAACAAVLLAASAAPAATGKTVTITGKLACAMCVLKQPDAKSCGNVLVVNEGGKEVLYALAQSEAAKAFDMAACEKALPVKVTGTVTEAGGKKTITAARIEKA